MEHRACTHRCSVCKRYKHRYIHHLTLRVLSSVIVAHSRRRRRERRRRVARASCLASWSESIDIARRVELIGTTFASHARRSRINHLRVYRYPSSARATRARVVVGARERARGCRETCLVAVVTMSSFRARSSC